MKKIVLLNTIVLLSIAATAQGIKFGLKAGANMLKVDNASFTDQYNLGYYGGVFVELHTGKKFYIAPELLFNQASVQTSDKFSDIYNNITLREVLSIQLNRLSIPVTFNYKVANILALSAGPVFSVNMNNEESFGDNLANAFTKGDIGLAAGANIHILKFRITGRYIAGLKNQNNIGENDPWKSQQVQLGVGFVF